MKVNQTVITSLFNVGTSKIEDILVTISDFKGDKLRRAEYIDTIRQDDYVINYL